MYYFPWLKYSDNSFAECVTTAKIFTVIVNTMRNVFEGLIYGLSVLLPVAIALGGLSAIGAYFKILIWLQLWVPFYVILNLYGDYEMAKSMEAIVGSLSGDGAPTMAQWITVGEKAQLNLAYLGSLSFAVPTFAWGLLKGGEYAMSAAVSAMSSGSGAASTAASVGGQAGVGNFSVGNKGIGNDSFWQQNSNSSRLVQADIQGKVQGALMVEGFMGNSPIQQSYKQSFQNITTRMKAWDAKGGNERAVSQNIGIGEEITANRNLGTHDGFNASGMTLADGVRADTTGETFVKGRLLANASGVNPDERGTLEELQKGATKLGRVEADTKTIDYFKNSAFLAHTGLAYNTIGGILARGPITDYDTLKRFSSDDFRNQKANTVLDGAKGYEADTTAAQTFGTSVGDVKRNKALGHMPQNDTDYRLGPKGEIQASRKTVGVGGLSFATDTLKDAIQNGDTNKVAALLGGVENIANNNTVLREYMRTAAAAVKETGQLSGVNEAAIAATLGLGTPSKSPVKAGVTTTTTGRTVEQGDQVFNGIQQKVGAIYADPNKTAQQKLDDSATVVTEMMVKLQGRANSSAAGNVDPWKGPSNVTKEQFDGTVQGKVINNVFHPRGEKN